MEKTINVKITLISESEFNLYFCEAETGNSVGFICHDQETADENRKIVNEIRSWVSLMREEMEETS